MVDEFYRHCGGPYCDAQRRHRMMVVGRTLKGLAIMRCRCCRALFHWDTRALVAPAGRG